MSMLVSKPKWERRVDIVSQKASNSEFGKAGPGTEENKFLSGKKCERRGGYVQLYFDGWWEN